MHMLCCFHNVLILKMNIVFSASLPIQNCERTTRYERKIQLHGLTDLYISKTTYKLFPLNRNVSDVSFRQTGSTQR